MVVVSVIVPTYIPAGDGGPQLLSHLLRCLRSVAKTAPSPQWVEILVQDDASPGIDTLVGALPDFVSLERAPRNGGFAANCNAAARRAGGDYLFFLNQDTVSLGDWYGPLLAAFSSHHAPRPVGLVGPKLLFPPGPAALAGDGELLAIQSCGGWYDAALQPTHRYLGYREDYERANKEEEEVSWITGAAHFWSRRAFEQIGGYDEAFRGGYFEDVDACCRVQQAGYQVRYCHRARFLHHTATTKAVAAVQFRQNMQLFAQRWVATSKVSPDTPAVYERWWV